MRILSLIFVLGLASCSKEEPKFDYCEIDEYNVQVDLYTGRFNGTLYCEMATGEGASNCANAENSSEYDLVSFGDSLVILQSCETKVRIQEDKQ